MILREHIDSALDLESMDRSMLLVSSIDSWVEGGLVFNIVCVGCLAWFKVAECD